LLSSQNQIYVKKAIVGQPYEKKIAYRQNEGNKPNDALDLIRIMFAFNIDEDSIKQPIQAYSSKAQVLKDYLSEYDDNNNNSYKKLALLLPEITKLYDQIELDMPAAYLKSNDNGQFGRIKGVDATGGKTKYLNEKLKYQISTGLLYPILGSFRALIEIDGDSYKWKVDPLEVWKNTSAKLVANTIAMSRQLGNNPQSAGKSSTLWFQNYDSVDSAKIKSLYLSKK